MAASAYDRFVALRCATLSSLFSRDSSPDSTCLVGMSPTRVVVRTTLAGARVHEPNPNADAVEYGRALQGPRPELR